MTDVGVALAWVAISGVSLKWLSVFARTSTTRLHAREPNSYEEDLVLEELYPLELFPVGGAR